MSSIFTLSIIFLILKWTLLLSCLIVIHKHYRVRFSWHGTHGTLHLVVDYLGGKGTAHAFTTKWIDHRGGVKYDKTMTSGMHESTRDLLNALTPSARRGSSSTIQNIVTTCNMYFSLFFFTRWSKTHKCSSRFTIFSVCLNVIYTNMNPNI